MAPSYATCGACGARFDGSKGHTCPKWNPSQADVTRWESIMRKAPPLDGADATGDRLTELARAQGIERIEGESDGLLIRRMGEAIYARHEGAKR